MSHSKFNRDKFTSRAWDILVRSLFLISFNLEKERSPLQLETIKDKKKIQSMISTFGKISQVTL